MSSHSGPSWKRFLPVCEEALYHSPSPRDRAWVHQILALLFSRAGNGRHLDGFRRIPPSPELAILWGGCRVSIVSPQSPQITFCPGLSDWYFSSLGKTVACGDERASLLWGKPQGDWEASALSPLSGTLPSAWWQTWKTLRSNSQIYHLETCTGLLILA